MPSSFSSRTLVLITGFLIMFVGSGARFTFGLTLVPMAEEFTLGRGILGTTVGVYYVVTALFMFLAGRMLDRYGARSVLVVGILVSAAGIGFIGLATSSWHLLALYGVLFGIGNGIASITPVSVLVTRLYPERAGAANGIISAGMSAGQLFVIAALVFVLVWAGWRLTYVLLGIAHLMLLPLLLSVPTDGGTAPGKPTAAASEGLTLGQASRTRRFWLLLAIYGSCGLDDFFVSTHIVAFAQDKGIDTLLAGNLLALMGATAMGGVLWAGIWADRYGLVAPMIACFALRIASFGVILISQSKPAVLLFTIIFGITFLMTAPLTVLAIRNCFGNKHLGTIAGFIIMIHHAMGGLGAWLGGALFDADGSYARAFAVMLVSSVLATAGCYALKREGIDKQR